jgi:hypothetical protein
MVWVLVAVVRLLVGFVISLDSCFVELYNVVRYGQNETKIAELSNIWT